MTINNITFEISDNDCRIYAICDGKSVGSIFFVKIGTDKIMISESEIDPSYKDSDIELNMVQQIIQMAREQHRKVMTICPYISNIFKNHPEFDDVRLLNNGR
ncbi:MAG: N-acetyltransferase [Alphaproteobacteria bacterium]|jgi:predicted GNAT family acetyltransferase|nr:N-acetyltransferase [Alphaproteobacteria bacterium]